MDLLLQAAAAPQMVESAHKTRARGELPSAVVARAALRRSSPPSSSLVMVRATTTKGGGGGEDDSSELVPWKAYVRRGEFLGKRPLLSARRPSNKRPFQEEDEDVVVVDYSKRRLSSPTSSDEEEDASLSGDDESSPRRSCLVDGVPQPLSLEAPAVPLMYEDLINFPRARGKTSARRCVMCGSMATGEGATCSIPLQNKDVCKRCDTGIWRHRETSEYFKWCKGCKKFLHVCSFAEKLAKCTTKYAKQPSKCDRCRERGRQSYMSKRLEAEASAHPPPRLRPASPSSTDAGAPPNRGPIPAALI